MSLGHGKHEIYIKPAKILFNHDQWYKLTVCRKFQEVRLKMIEVVEKKMVHVTCNFKVKRKLKDKIFRQ